MLELMAAIALAATVFTGAAGQSGETVTPADGDRPIIVQGGGDSPTSEGDPPIIVQGGGQS